MPIDLSQLAAPSIIEPLDYASILQSMKDDLIALNPDLSDTLGNEAEPLTLLLQVAAYRELIIRQDFNDRAKAVLLAYSWGANLDHIGVTYYRTERLLISSGDPSATPPVDPVYESDDAYRARLQLAPEGFSTAGPEQAYIFHAKSASGQVKDVSVVNTTESGTATAGTVNSLTDIIKAWEVDEYVTWQVTITAGTGAGQTRTIGANTATMLTPTVDWETAPDATSQYTISIGGDLTISVLSTIGNGTPDAALLTAVNEALDDQYIRPLTDKVTVQAAVITDYTITAELTVYPGPDQETVRLAAEAAVTQYATDNHKLGRDITIAGLLGALVVEGVQNVNLISPAADIVNDPTQASYANLITVSIVGTGE